MCIYIYMHICIYVIIYIHDYIHTHTYTYTCTCVYIYTYIHIYTHAYTHFHSQSGSSRRCLKDDVSTPPRCPRLRRSGANILHQRTSSWAWSFRMGVEPSFIFIYLY